MKGTLKMVNSRTDFVSMEVVLSDEESVQTSETPGLFSSYTLDSPQDRNGGFGHQSEPVFGFKGEEEGEELDRDGEVQMPFLNEGKPMYWEHMAKQVDFKVKEMTKDNLKLTQLVAAKDTECEQLKRDLNALRTEWKALRKADFELKNAVVTLENELVIVISVGAQSLPPIISHSAINQVSSLQQGRDSQARLQFYPSIRFETQGGNEAEPVETPTAKSLPKSNFAEKRGQISCRV